MYIREKLKFVKKLREMGIMFNLAILKISSDYMEKIIDALEDAFKRFPIVKEYLCFISLRNFKEWSIVSGTKPIIGDKHLIRLNKKRWSSDDLEKTLFIDFSNRVFTTLSIKGNIFHEIGHIIEYIILSKTDYKTINELLEECEIMPHNYADFSFRAGENSREAFAEIFAALMTEYLEPLNLENDLDKKAMKLYNRIVETLNK